VFNVKLTQLLGFHLRHYDLTVAAVDLVQQFVGQGKRGLIFAFDMTMCKVKT
jgi:hypothetical protein